MKHSRETFGLAVAIVIFMLVVPSVYAEAIIADHNAVQQFDQYKNTAEFQNAIETAKNTFHIGYGHTSHGSQITSGMTGLNTFMNNLGYPPDLFDWNNGGTGGALDLEEGDGYGNGWLDHDCGYSGWDQETRYYLDSNDPDEPYENHSDVDGIMWSWCGQVDAVNIQTHYLDNMADLESEYPNVTFIYMTGHLEGRKTGDSWFDNNNAIRDWVSGTDRVLFDFADVEKYDPDQVFNYANYFADDNCDYDSDGTAPRNENRNWATDWQNNHTEDTDWYSCSCAHSQSLNCNQKAKAFWWMMARLAGWDGLPEDDVIYVPGDYTSIQAAVNAAIAGDTIIVRDGTYTENVNVNKRLIIRSENGAGNCIVNAADPCDHVFELLVDSVIINGFTVRNGTGDMITWKIAGILVTHSDHVNISDCVVENNVFGIRTDFSYYSELTGNIVRNNTHGVYLASSPHATLTQNTLSNNSYKNIETSGTNTASYWHKHTIDTTNTVNGKPVYYYTDSYGLVLENLDAGHISLVDCNGATVRGCSVIGCDNIRLVSTDDGLIEGNTVCDTEYAIRLLYSDKNIVRDNTANDNGGNGNGIRVQHGVDNRIENNTLKRNYQGIYVEGCENITIINNRIDGNIYGCWLYNQNRILNNTIQGSEYYGLNIMGDENQVAGNTIFDNGNTSWSCGITFSDYSSNNLIYNNYFDNPNNTRDDGSNNIWNTTNTTGPNIIGGPFIGGNYWSDYTGSDDNGDGFGKTAYNITGGTNRDYLPLVRVQGLCGDVDCNGLLNIMDVRLLLNHVNNPGGYPVDSWTGNVSGGEGINLVDVQRLLAHIFDPVGHLLECTYIEG